MNKNEKCEKKEEQTVYEEINDFHLYMSQVMNIVQMSAEEELELVKKIEMGDEQAKNQLYMSNLWLVPNIAQRHINRGVPLMDLIQEGNIGLIYALDKYDYRKGTKFSNYAGNWIRKKMIEAIAESGSTFKVPINKLYAYYRIGITNHNLTRVLDRKPTTTDIAEEMNVSENYVSDILLLFSEPVSFDNARENIIHPDTENGDIIPPEQIILKREKAKRLAQVFQILTPQEETIIRMYYGFDNSRGYTSDMIAKDLQISRQRVDFLRKRAIEKIRKDLCSDGSNLFEEYC